MADMLDIFNLEPSKIDRTLKGKYILLYGAPKTGKSTFGSKLPRALFLKLEEGTNALSGIRGVPILKWTDIKKIVKSLRDPRAREMYDTVVVDTVGIAYQLCENYILQQEGVNNIRDIPWGAGFNMVKKEFTEVWREISLLGFGILYISHEKTYSTGITNEAGEEIIGVKPDLNNSCANIINAQVDIISYLQTVMMPDGSTDRKLYTRATPYIFAGNRYKYLAPVIPFGDDGYDELIKAIGDAIDKDVNLNGALVTDVHVEQTIERRQFKDVMDEAKELWTSYIQNGSDDEEKEVRFNTLNALIVKIFGKQMKLSSAIPSQQDLVELFISEAKDIIKEN